MRTGVRDAQACQQIALGDALMLGEGVVYDQFADRVGDSLVTVALPLCR